MPTPVDEATMCALAEHWRNFQQREEEKDDLFCVDENSELMHHLEAFCQDTAEFWWEEKWGNCRDAPFLRRDQRRGGQGIAKELNLGKRLERLCEG